MATTTIVVASAADVSQVRPVVDANHGRIARRDGLMVALFETVYDGLAAAVGLQQVMDRDGDVDGAGALRVSVHVGDLVGHRDDDVFGGAVRFARELCDAAAPGTIVASPVVQALGVGRADFTFEAHDANFVVPWVPAVAPRLRVVVAEDAALIRAGIVRLLASEGFEVVAEAGDYDSLLAAVDREPPDLVITDIRMPPTQTDEGLRAAAQIRATYPAVAVLVLSQHVVASAAATLLDGERAGIGYLLKERVTEIDEFVEAARRVARGESVIDPLISDELMRVGADDALAQLTERERDVLALMAQGFSNQAICDELVVSSKTIESHVRAIFQKLDLPEGAQGNRRVQAVIRWLDRAR